MKYLRSFQFIKEQVDQTLDDINNWLYDLKDWNCKIDLKILWLYRPEKLSDNHNIEKYIQRQRSIPTKDRVKGYVISIDSPIIKNINQNLEFMEMISELYNRLSDMGSVKYHNKEYDSNDLIDDDGANEYSEEEDENEESLGFSKSRYDKKYFYEFLVFKNEKYEKEDEFETIFNLIKPLLKSDTGNYKSRGLNYFTNFRDDKEDLIISCPGITQKKKEKYQQQYQKGDYKKYGIHNRSAYDKRNSMNNFFRAKTIERISDRINRLISPILKKWGWQLKVESPTLSYWADSSNHKRIIIKNDVGYLKIKYGINLNSVII